MIQRSELEAFIEEHRAKEAAKKAEETKAREERATPEQAAAWAKKFRDDAARLARERDAKSL